MTEEFSRRAGKFDQHTSEGLAFQETESGYNEPECIVGFDFEAVFENLDGENPDLEARVKALAAESLGRMMRTLVRGPAGQMRDAATVGKALVALAYASDLESATMSEIGQRFGVSKQMVSKFTEDARVRFGVVGRMQSSPSARAAMRGAQVGDRHWRKKRETAQPA